MHDRKSPFVGRVPELDALHTLSRSGPVWVWGPPGVGKSRLAEEWLAREGGGVRVDLGGTNTVEELAGALSAALAVAVAGHTQGERLASIRQILSGMPRVLVLDNVDGMRPAVESVLGGVGAPIVVTARAAPAAEAIAAFRLDPLSDSASEEMFATLVQLVSPGATWEPQMLFRLVRRLDGLPLAIELAAHRTRVLTVQDQVARLEAGAAPAMAGALATMWEGLEPSSRALLVQACAFPDGFTAGAIEATAALGSGVDALDVLDRLYTSSWLHRTQGAQGTYRFGLLQALRDFVRGIAAPDQLAAAADRALSYWAAQAPALGAAVEMRNGRGALAELESERENILSAAAAGLGHHDRRALVVLTALRWNACLVGPPYRYTELVDRARQLASQCDDTTAATFLAFAAEFWRRTGHAPEAERDARLAIERASAAGHEPLLLRAFVTASAVGGAARSGVPAMQEVARRAEDLGAHGTRAAALLDLGQTYLAQDDVDAAEDAFREAQDTYRAYGSDLFTVDCQVARSRALSARGRHDDAAAQLRAAVDAAADEGLAMQAATLQHELAIALHAAGQLDEACTCVDRAMGMWTELGAPARMPASLIEAARIAWDMDAPTRATQLAHAARQHAGLSRDRRHDAVAAGLAAMFQWADGRTTSEEELLDAVPILQPLDPVAAVAHLTAVVGLRAHRGSSAQREVARAATIAHSLTDAPASLRETLERLCAIARGFGHLCDATRVGAPHAGAEARRAAERELGADTAARTALLDGGNDFYVRLLLARARQLLQTLEGNPLLHLPEGLRHDVEFHANCHWVRIDGGEPIDLSSRKQLRVIVKALARQYFADPAVLVSVEELLEVGWPGEAMTPASGRSRIYTAIRDLRKMGLDALIVTEDGGYRLAHDVRFRVAAPTGILAHY